MGASWYNSYLDVEVSIWFVSWYVSKHSKMPKEVVSSMKADTPVIRSTVHSLLLQWMEYLLLELQLVEPKHNFAELYQNTFTIW